MIEPIYYEDEKLYIVDQRKLPQTLKIVEINSVDEVVEAIKSLMVRGAPAIGITGAYGLVLGLKDWKGSENERFFKQLDTCYKLLLETRPTAVNLSWALNRLKRKASSLQEKPPGEIWEALLEEARNIHDEEKERCEKISLFGASLIPDGANIITHCNTGPLATGGLGTALGSIIIAHEEGKKVHVFVDETRPLLQGARLTAWELEQAGIPHTLITDSMAGFVMATQKVDLVIVGADRIAMNGDTANKIGTYNLAILAWHHEIPFYVAAPLSTIDPNIENGNGIPIEFRKPDEVTHFNGKRVAHEKCRAISPAFDVTPSGLITAIITERGIYKFPYNFSKSEIGSYI